LRARREVAHRAMYSPEPTSVTDGRRYLYDANFTSDNGTQACASCHIGGDFDGLAWDLGNPGGMPLPITKLPDEDTLFSIRPSAIVKLLPSSAALFAAFQPLKGPMTTQSLRGLDNHGAM